MSSPGSSHEEGSAVRITCVREHEAWRVLGLPPTSSEGVAVRILSQRPGVARASLSGAGQLLCGESQGSVFGTDVKVALCGDLHGSPAHLAWGSSAGIAPERGFRHISSSSVLQSRRQSRTGFLKSSR